MHMNRDHWNSPCPVPVCRIELPVVLHQSLRHNFQDKLEYLSVIQEKVKIFSQDHVIFENAEAKDIAQNSDAKSVFACFLKEMSSAQKWDAKAFNRIMKTIQEETSVKGKELWMPIRVALTGQTHGPDLSQVAEILGFEKCKRFIEQNLE